MQTAKNKSQKENFWKRGRISSPNKFPKGLLFYLPLRKTINIWKLKISRNYWRKSWKPTKGYNFWKIPLSFRIGIPFALPIECFLSRMKKTISKWPIDNSKSLPFFTVSSKYRPNPTSTSTEVSFVMKTSTSFILNFGS